jgi:hypothetical protein
MSSEDFESAEEDIYCYLSKYGRIVSVNMKGFGKTGKPFGTVGFSSQ